MEIWLDEVPVELTSMKFFLMKVLKKLIIIDVVGFDTRSRGFVPELEAASLNHHFCVSWIGLVLDSFGINTNNSIEDLPSE